MIKFFRKIRQKLVEENKVGNYLKYAIGEIFLVVIGILIALSINNWNEDRKRNLQEIRLAIQLLEDARADSVFFESRLDNKNRREIIYDNLLNLSKGLHVDSISTLQVTENPFFQRLAHQSNLIKNNPNAYDFISPSNIKSALREYIKRHDYVVNGIELSNRIYEAYGIPLELKYHSQTSNLPESPTYKDYIFVLEDLETLARIQLFKDQKVNYGITCENFLLVNHTLITLLDSYIDDNQ